MFPALLHGEFIMLEHLIVYLLPLVLCIVALFDRLDWQCALSLVVLTGVPRKERGFNVLEWTINAGCMYITPLTILLLVTKYESAGNMPVSGLISLLAFESFEAMFRTFGSEVHLRSIVALFLFTVESCLFMNVSVRWGIYLLVSLFIIGVIEDMLKLNRSRTAATSSNTVQLGLSSYERRIAFTVWGMLLERLAHYWHSKSSINLVMMEPSATHSVQQCSLVVEIFTTAILLTILKTETIMHAIANASEYMFQRSANGRNAVNYTPIRRLVYVLVVAINTATVLVPQLHSIGIANFPLWLLRFLLRAPYYELYLCLYWVAMIAVFAGIAYYAATVWRWPRTCNRKIFHFLVVLMFAPALCACSQLRVTGLRQYEAAREGLYSTLGYRMLAFLVLALGVAVNVFVLFEYVRLCLLGSTAHVPHTANASSTTEHSFASAMSCHGTHSTSNSIASLGHRMEQYMQLFLPEDKSTAIICADGTVPGQQGVKTLEMSHISLLLGCAAPVWLFALIIGQTTTNAQVTEEHHQKVSTQYNSVEIARILILCIVPYAGLLTLGVGDACAAIVGKLYGTHRWYSREGPNSSNTRTIEGSVACFVSMLCATSVLVYAQNVSMQHFLMQHSVDHGVQSFVVFMCTPGAVLLSLGVVVTLLLTTAAEAITTENDNILLPMYMILLLLAWREVFM